MATKVERYDPEQHHDFVPSRGEVSFARLWDGVHTLYDGTFMQAIAAVLPTDDEGFKAAQDLLMQVNSRTGDSLPGPKPLQGWHYTIVNPWTEGTSDAFIVRRNSFGLELSWKNTRSPEALAEYIERHGIYGISILTDGREVHVDRKALGLKWPVYESPIARPHNDLVLVRALAARDEKRGHILIPQFVQSKTANDEKTYFRTSDQWTVGLVCSVGPGARRMTNEGEGLQGRNPCGVSVGEMVIYKRAEASPFPGGLVIVRECSIAGMLDYVEAGAQMELTGDTDGLPERPIFEA